MCYLFSNVAYEQLAASHLSCYMYCCVVDLTLCLTTFTSAPQTLWFCSLNLPPFTFAVYSQVAMPLPHLLSRCIHPADRFSVTIAQSYLYHTPLANRLDTVFLEPILGELSLLSCVSDVDSQNRRAYRKRNSVAKLNRIATH